MRPSSNVALGQTQTSTTLALTKAEGNTTVLNALDQRITAELATKLTSSDLNPYATQTSVTELGALVAVNASAAQLAQLAVAALQASVNSALSLKADQRLLVGTPLAYFPLLCIKT